MIGVLVSGEGSNLQALLDDGLPVVAVASNKPGIRALERAERAGLPAATFALDDYASREERDLAMATWLADHGVTLVACAGYMQLLSPPFLARFPNRIVNIHPSLLPAFPGTHPIEEAVESGASETGVTVHLVDEGIDSGPILAQARLALHPGETAESVRSRIHDVEHRLYPRVIRELIG